MTPGVTTQRIEPDFRTKIWGSPRLEPWFEPPITQGGDPVGEVWFPADDLLIKFLFTSQNLSVQVHPDDEYAKRNSHPCGKTEMWHILRADPGARIALGFKPGVSPDQLIPAAQTGEIMNLLNWIDVHPGETYFVPAGTVHAIGSGIALCEIQQNSDVTYRLFDYGRDRELHLQPAQEIMHAACHPGKSIPRDIGNGIHLLVECSWFRTYSTIVDRPKDIDIQTRILIVLEGAGNVNGIPVSPGHVLKSTGLHPWHVNPGTSGSLNVLLVA